jgi:GT2 family glycosyltransferase
MTRIEGRLLVSVVIPVLNGAAFLGEQLAALSNDSAQPFETVVADNGSSDDTLQVARSFASRMPLVIVDACEQRGQAFARNVGARAAAGDALLFLDQDDVVAPGYVTAMTEALRRVELVAARMDTRTLNRGWRQFSRQLVQIDGLPVEPVTWAYGCTLGVRRDTFERLGGFATDLGTPAGEDVDFCWRAKEQGIEIAFAPDAILRYRFRTSLYAIFRQGRQYGFSGVLVAARHGIMPPARSLLARSFLGPLRLVILGPSMGQRAYGLFLLGRRVGTLQASRTLNP